MLLKYTATKVRNEGDVRRVSEQLGVTAVVVNDLKRSRMNNYTFQWEDALNFNGDTGVFLQYTHARLHKLVGVLAFQVLFFCSGFTIIKCLDIDFHLDRIF